MPVEIADLALRGTHKPQQQIGHILLCEAGQMLTAAVIFDHQFAVGAYTSRLRLLRLLARIDKAHQEVLLRTLIAAEESAYQLARVALGILGSCISSYADRSGYLLQHIDRSLGQRITLALRQIPLRLDVFCDPQDAQRKRNQQNKEQ